MQPQEPQNNDNSSYEFILKTEEPPQKSLIERLDTKKLFIFGAIFTLLLVTFALFMSSMQAKAAAEQVDRLTKIAQMQTEIVRVAGIGAEQATEAKNQDRAKSIRDSVGESLQSTRELLQSRGALPDDETLAKLQNSGSDDSLTKATEFGTFDKTFEKLIDGQITEYQQALLSADKAGNASEKQALEDAYTKANSILGLVDQTK